MKRWRGTEEGIKGGKEGGMLGWGWGGGGGGEGGMRTSNRVWELQGHRAQH